MFSVDRVRVLLNKATSINEMTLSVRVRVGHLENGAYVAVSNPGLTQLVTARLGDGWMGAGSSSSADFIAQANNRGGGNQENT